MGRGPPECGFGEEVQMAAWVRKACCDRGAAYLGNEWATINLVYEAMVALAHGGRGNYRTDGCVW